MVRGVLVACRIVGGWLDIGSRWPYTLFIGLIVGLIRSGTVSIYRGKL